MDLNPFLVRPNSGNYFPPPAANGMYQGFVDYRMLRPPYLPPLPMVYYQHFWSPIGSAHHHAPQDEAMRRFPILPPLQDMSTLHVPPYQGMGRLFALPPYQGPAPIVTPVEPFQPPVLNPPVLYPPVRNPPFIFPPVRSPSIIFPPVRSPSVINSPVTNPPVINSPVIYRPVTNAPVTNPPVMNPPVINSPVINPPVINPPVINPPVTNPPDIRPPAVNKPTQDNQHQSVNSASLYNNTRRTEDAPRFKVESSSNNDTDINYEPVYVLDASQDVFMYMNVQLRRLQEPHILECLHPNCQYFEPIQDLFTEQFSWQHLRFHIKQKHRKAADKNADPSNRNLHFCFICKENFNSRVDLLWHQEDNHRQQNFDAPLALCEICGDTMSRSLMVKHILSHKSEQEKFVTFAQSGKARKKTDITRPLIFPCPQCDKVFQIYTQFRHHAATHITVPIKKPSFSCQSCDKTFETEAAVETHKLQEHLTKDLFKACIVNENEKKDDAKNDKSHKKPYECSKCGRRFKVYYYLKRHEKYHTETQFKCKYCPEIFISWPCLNKHQLIEHPKVEAGSLWPTNGGTNTVAGPRLMYPCEPCEKVYPNKNELVHHLKGTRHNFNFKSVDDYPLRWTMEDESAYSSSIFGRQKKEIILPDTVVVEYCGELKN